MAFGLLIAVSARVEAYRLFSCSIFTNMDDWVPAVTNGIAALREVILFNNAGVASSGGETPASVLEMTQHCVAFLLALGLEEIDVVGFSLGG